MLWEARQQCPSLVCVPAHYERYLAFSAQARDIYTSYTDRRYSLAPDQSQEIAQIVAEVQARFGVASIHTGEIFPTNAAPVLLPGLAAERSTLRTPFRYHGAMVLLRHLSAAPASGHGH